MLLNRLYNRKAMAIMPLLAMLLFVVVLKEHTHEQRGPAEYPPIGETTLGHVLASHTDHCTACELIALGTGNTLIVATVHTDAIRTQEPITVIPNNTVQPGHRIALPSRAPPA